MPSRPAVVVWAALLFLSSSACHLRSADERDWRRIVEMDKEANRYLSSGSYTDETATALLGHAKTFSDCAHTDKIHEFFRGRCAESPHYCADYFRYYRDSTLKGEIEERLWSGCQENPKDKCAYLIESLPNSSHVEEARKLVQAAAEKAEQARKPVEKEIAERERAKRIVKAGPAFTANWKLPDQANCSDIATRSVVDDSEQRGCSVRVYEMLPQVTVCYDNDRDHCATLRPMPGDNPLPLTAVGFRIGSHYSPSYCKLDGRLVDYEHESGRRSLFVMPGRHEVECAINITDRFANHQSGTAGSYLVSGPLRVVFRASGDGGRKTVVISGDTEAVKASVVEGDDPPLR